MDENLLRAGMFDEEQSNLPSTGAIDAANQQLADAGTADQQAAPPEPATFDVQVETQIPSSTLEGNATFDDVRAQRSALEQQRENAPNLDQFEEVTSEASVFNDPQSFIESALFGDREPTQAEQQAATLRGDITESIGGTEEALTATTRRAEETTQLSERSQRLAKTNEDIAARTTRFRRELREFEADAENRGVARAFFEDSRNKLKADATAELADLYIIQNAQQGNVAAARDYIKTAVDNRYRSIEIELKQKQAALNELIPTLQGEEKKRAQQLNFALGERTRNLNTEKEEATARRELALTAAKNGADQSTISSITNAKSVDEALTLSSPYIGLLERQAANRAASNAALSRRKSLIELAMMGDTAAINELGAYGEHLQNIKGDKEKVQRENAFNDATEKVDLAQRLSQNTLGLDMNTGISQSGYGIAAATTLATTLAGFGVAGPVGAVAGFVGGVGAGAVAVSQAQLAKENFQADIKSLVAPEALNELVRQKEAGATFGALSNAELGLLLAASQELSGHVNINDSSGAVTLIGSPDAIQADLNKVISFYQKAQFETNKQEVDASSSSQIDSLFVPQS